MPLGDRVREWALVLFETCWQRLGEIWEDRGHREGGKQNKDRLPPVSTAASSRLCSLLNHSPPQVNKELRKQGHVWWRALVIPALSRAEAEGLQPSSLRLTWFTRQVPDQPVQTQDQTSPKHQTLKTTAEGSVSLQRGGIPYYTSNKK